MWLMLKEGFYSVACGMDGAFVDPEVKMIRARCKQQLNKLKASYPKQLKNKKVIFTTGTDYPFRIVMTQVEFESLTHAISRSIDYGNFKDAAGESNPADWHYINMLHKLWQYWYNIKGGFFEKERITDGSHAAIKKAANGKRRSKKKGRKQNIQGNKQAK